MSYSQLQLTQYAHEYLSGGNLVPIGALDDPFFKSECARLWGPVTPRSEASIRLQRRTLNRLIRARDSLLGPKGGAPKSGEASRQYKNLQYNIALLQEQYK